MMMWILLILLALAAVVFAVAPCLGDKALRAPFQNRNYAHRGLFTQDQSVPENSIPAFEAAARAGYGIELDVQFTQDKRLVVFHDDTVDRMTSARGLVQDMPYAAFANLTLAGTKYHPPLFGDMLRAVAAANPETPLIVEIKSRRELSEAYLKELCAATLDCLGDYPGPYCIESFDPRVVRIIRRTAPGVLRGQLVDCYQGYRGEGAAALYAYGISHCLCNLMGRPHFIAWCPEKRNWAVRLCAAMGAMMVMWTALPADDANRRQAENDAVIFQWYTPEPKY